jgi:O-antigen/teichoic acid export membrane protein
MPRTVSGSRSRHVLGRLPACAAEGVLVVEAVLVVGTVTVGVRRDGAVGVICDEDVDVEPLANAPAGMAKEVPIRAIAAADRTDFTSNDTLDQRPIADRADRLVRYMHAFSASAEPSATVPTRMRERITPLLEQLRGSDTGKAAGLAGAMIVNNVIALVISVIFSHVVGDYGSLAALLSYLVIISVVGQAMQVATAREGVLGHLGEGEELLRTLERWAKTMVLFTIVATIVSILLRQPIADLVGVKHDPWPAAAGIPAGCAYLWVCILRGALQGTGDYRSLSISLVGEQSVRLVAGTVLAEIGLGLGGAYLGTLIAYVAMAGYCTVILYRDIAGATYPRWRLGGSAQGAFSLWHHVRSAAVPIVALGIVQLLQNVDLIVAKHRFTESVASSYAAVAVAAKVLIWVAMGASFYLVPETSRRHSEGQHTRPVLLKSLAIIAVCAVPCLLIFALGSHPLISIVFGKDRAIASSSLLPLGAAFTMLSATYLAVQYLLALRRVWFLAAIGLVAAVEPVLLLAAPQRPKSFALVVLAIQTAGALIAYAIALSVKEPVVVAPDVASAAPVAHAGDSGR